MFDKADMAAKIPEVIWINDLGVQRLQQNKNSAEGNSFMIELLENNKLKWQISFPNFKSWEQFATKGVEITELYKEKKGDILFA